MLCNIKVKYVKVVDYFQTGLETKSATVKSEFRCLFVRLFVSLSFSRVGSMVLMLGPHQKLLVHTYSQLLFLCVCSG